MKGISKVFLMVVCLFGLYGCGETENRLLHSSNLETSILVEETNEVEKEKEQQKEVILTKRLNSIEELNNNFFELQETLNSVNVATAYANFDFPIYEINNLALHKLGNMKYYYTYKNDQFAEIIDVFGKSDSSTNKYTPKALYMVTGFYDENDPLYREILEKYSEVTYEETAERQTIHWVTSDGLYHRYLVLGIDLIDNEKFIRDTTLAKENYERKIENPPILPSYFLYSAIDQIIDESEIKVSTYSANGGTSSGGGSAYITVPLDTSQGKAIHLGNKILSKTVELMKNSSIYQEELWKDYELVFEIKYSDIDTDAIFLTGYKNGVDTFEWRDLFGSVVRFGNNSTFTITDVFTEADRYLERERHLYEDSYFREDIFKINIDNDPYPEIFTLEMLPNGKSEISVLEFNFETEQWEKAYSDTSYEHYDGTDALQVLGVAYWLTENEEQYVFLGRVSGSGAYLSFFVLGSDNDGNVKVVLDRMDAQLHNGELLIDDGAAKIIKVKKDGEVVEEITLEDLRAGR